MPVWFVRYTFPGLQLFTRTIFITVCCIVLFVSNSDVSSLWCDLSLLTSPRFVVLVRPAADPTSISVSSLQYLQKSRLSVLFSTSDRSYLMIPYNHNGVTGTLTPRKFVCDHVIWLRTVSSHRVHTNTHWLGLFHFKHLWCGVTIYKNTGSTILIDLYISLCSYARSNIFIYNLI